MTSTETRLFDQFIFGPVQSRRLGRSLGINLLSTSAKVCNFNCIYCECGLNEDHKISRSKFADSVELLAQLEATLASGNTQNLDALTYAGNGEPTLHPHFEHIAQMVHDLKCRYAPKAKIVLLTNGTTLHKRSVLNALKHIDSVVVKLDAGTEELIESIDQPLSPFKIDDFIHQIKHLNHEVIIQTMFISGTVDGKSFDNTSEENIKIWLERINEIKPKEVMLYSIDRSTPYESLTSVSKSKLLEIAARVNNLGIKTQVV